VTGDTLRSRHPNGRSGPDADRAAAQRRAELGDQRADRSRRGRGSPSAESAFGAELPQAGRTQRWRWVTRKAIISLRKLRYLVPVSGRPGKSGAQDSW